MYQEPNLLPWLLELYGKIMEARPTNSFSFLFFDSLLFQKKI
jgi:hypothetical protein